MSPGHGLILAPGLALLFSGCIQAQEDELAKEYESSGVPITVSEASYRTTWDWGAATPHDDQGWSVTNNLGIEFRVDSGHLTAYAASLVPCTLAKRSEWSLWPIAKAYADHGVSADPSVQPIPVIEDLANPSESVLAEVSFPESVYCQVHYLVAGATEDSEHLFSDEILGQSVSIQGAYRAQAEDPWTELELASEFPNGSLHRIQLDQSGPEPRAEVLIQRALGLLFDDLDPLSMSDGELDFQLLTNLMDHTQVSVTLVPNGN